MFEKEAEEYLKTQCQKRKEEFVIRMPEVYIADIPQAFKAGAEFGYNKAKEEWKKHFLQCSSPFCLDNFSEVKCYGELGNMTKKESE